MESLKTVMQGVAVSCCLAHLLAVHVYEPAVRAR